MYDGEHGRGVVQVIGDIADDKFLERVITADVRRYVNTFGITEAQSQFEEGYVF
jgi:hypothetical protein